MASGITGTSGYRSRDGKVTIEMMTDAYKEVLKHQDELDLTRLELYVFGSENLPVFMDARDAEKLSGNTDLVRVLAPVQLYPLIENNQKYHSLTYREAAKMMMNAVPYGHRSDEDESYDNERMAHLNG